MVKLRTIITGGLAALVLSLSGSSLPPVEQNMARSEQKVEVREEASNYGLIKDYVSESLLKHVQENAKASDYYKKNIEKHGVEGFARGYEQGHTLCLDLAEQLKEKGKDIDNCDILGRKLCEQQDIYSTGHVNFFDNDVVAAQTQWGEVRAKHFLKLLKTKGKFNTFNELIRASYTEEEYKGYIHDQNQANDNFYDALNNTMDPVTKFLGGDKEIERLRKLTKKLYEDTIPEFFKDTKPKPK